MLISSSGKLTMNLMNDKKSCFYLCMRHTATSENPKTDTIVEKTMQNLNVFTSPAPHLPTA